MIGETVTRDVAIWRRYDLQMREFLHTRERAIRKCSGAFVMALPQNSRRSYAPEPLGQFWDNDRGPIVQSKMHFYRRSDDR